MRFCLQPDKMSRTWMTEFLELNWLNVHGRYIQFFVFLICKIFSNQCPGYFDEVFCPVGNNGVAMYSSSFFCFWGKQILTFQMFKCHGIIKCPSIKQNILLNDMGSKHSLIMKFYQFIILQKKDFYQKIVWKMLPGN